jgi:hypothetical protein
MDGMAMTIQSANPTPDTAFHIDWDVPESEWLRARETAEREPIGGYYDQRSEAFFLLLRGSLQFRRYDMALFPRGRLREVAERRRTNHMEMGDPWYPIPADHGSKGVQAKTLDFANQLIAIIGILATNSTVRSRLTTFWPNEGGIRILFSRYDELVSIESELFPDLILSIPFDEFMPEVYRFLRDFIMALDQHVPGILDWVSFERLRTYAQERGIAIGD